MANRCTRISTFIVSYIQSAKVPRLNMLSIVTLKHDLHRLTTFAESTGVPQLKQCFAELEDVVNALLHQDLLQFGENPKLLGSLFPRLDPLKLAAIVEKISPYPIALSDKSLPNIDKKLASSLAKQLRSRKQSSKH